MTYLSIRIYALDLMYMCHSLGMVIINIKGEIDPGFQLMVPPIPLTL